MGIKRLLDWDLEISPLAADRAIVWCNNVDQQKALVRLDDCFLPAAPRVSFRSWSPEAQLHNSKVECCHGWIGVEGLPLNMWNINAFKVLGRMCGGLLDVDITTAEKTLLVHARLKLKGFEGGFIPENLSVLCWGKETKLKFFALNDRRYRFHGVCNTKWKTPEVEDGDVEVPLPLASQEIETQPLSENFSEIYSSPRDVEYCKQRNFGPFRGTAVWRRRMFRPAHLHLGGYKILSQCFRRRMGHCLPWEENQKTFTQKTQTIFLFLKSRWKITCSLMQRKPLCGLSIHLTLEANI